MSAFLLGAGAAFWVGFLTAISPCPMATSATAVSFIGRKVNQPRSVLWAGLVYVLGRSLAYVGLCALLTAGFLSVPGLSQFLQKQINQILGVLLVLVGFVLLNMNRLPDFGNGQWLSRLAGLSETYGLWGAGLLGFVFALAFCPISAALFFGSLLPLCVQHKSIVFFPFLFGVGSALPVVVLAMSLSMGAGFVGRFFNKMTVFDKGARVVTGIVFVLAGSYLMWVYFLKF